MGRRGGGHGRGAGSGGGGGGGASYAGLGGGIGDAIAETAARIFVEEALVDYGAAKRRAAERLGLSQRGGLPDNARIEAAVLSYQRLFGGRAYAERLRTLRRVAVRAMQTLAGFEPRLVGAVATGAISEAHRVQLHAFPTKPELLDVFLADRRIAMQADERDYRWPDGRTRAVPLARFELDGVGVDVALFAPEDLRQAPCSPVDGRPVRRVGLAEAVVLAEQAVDVL